MATGTSPAPATRAGGDADISTVARLFADPTRARVLTALADGRSLAASVLAHEAGVSPQAASAQLKRLCAAGLIVGETSGRHRFYKLASAHVAGILEALAGAAPAQPIRSLREGTRAAALRRARTCYDHLAGRLGCDITAALLAHGALRADDGIADTRRRDTDPISAAVPQHPYRLGPNAGAVLGELGVELPAPDESTRRCRVLLRFCVDWSEQRHHLAGELGARILASLEESGWVTRRAGHRAVTISERGHERLRDVLGIE